MVVNCEYESCCQTADLLTAEQQTSETQSEGDEQAENEFKADTRGFLGCLAEAVANDSRFRPSAALCFWTFFLSDLTSVIATQLCHPAL
jgi:hypothetical protein